MAVYDPLRERSAAMGAGIMQGKVVIIAAAKYRHVTAGQAYHPAA